MTRYEQTCLRLSLVCFALAGLALYALVQSL